MLNKVISDKTTEVKCRRQSSGLPFPQCSQNLTIGIIYRRSVKMEFDRAYEAKKHVTDYVFSDSKGERQFAEALDEASC